MSNDVEKEPVREASAAKALEATVENDIAEDIEVLEIADPVDLALNRVNVCFR